MAEAFSRVLLLLLSVFPSVCLSVTVDLGGNWTVLNKAKGYKIPGRVPGSMYTALYDNQLIPNPLYRDNDVKLRWIGRENWTYTRTFQFSSTERAFSSIHLVCDGLDTFSTVYINDQKVGTSENMFVQYVYDIKSAVKVTGDNTIRIDFQSSVGVAAQKANATVYDYVPDCPDPVQHGECHVNMIRKEQCSFSWNWGPSFPTQGIWKNIYIETFNTAEIRELSVAPRPGSGGEWLVDVGVYFDVSGGQVTGTLTTNIAGTSVTKSQPVTLTSSNNSVIYTITIPSNINIERWWPNGYGNQTLYTVNVTFSSNSEVSNKQHRVGFRSVELVQDPVRNNQGLTFYFKINDVPVFFKGSNWIPADSFQETITRERLRRLLKSAADVHINSMRVWGGGVYESEDFYDLADEFGIMIWQDLMFSDAFYPASPDFLNTVSREITHQVRRTRHHPCIAVWSGNNEMEVGLRDRWFDMKTKDFKRYYDDYVKLYVTTIMPIVTKEDPTRTYLTSSPSNGKETEKEGWVAKDPSSEYYGDIHYYNDTSDMWKDSAFKIPRFTSEFGIQSWCDLETLEDVLETKDFDYWGNMTYHRLHNAEGRTDMMKQVDLHFYHPTTTDPKQFFIDMIYLTQINQALSIQSESEHYRRWQNDLTPDGRGQTMGALYWQLNDIWQAPTWASLDYKGKWKMLHYYVQRFYAPILISPYVDDSNNLNVYMVVDEIPLFEVKDTGSGVNQFVPASTKTDILYSTFPHREHEILMEKTIKATTGTLFVQMYRWDNFVPLKTWNTTYKLTRSSELVFRHDINSLMTDAKCPDQSNCFLYMYINDPRSGINANLPLSYYKSVKGLTRANTKFTSITKLSDTEFLVKLELDRIAPFVWLDAYGIPGRFSDNGFLMLTPSREVTFTSWDPADLDQFRKSLTVKSLMDVEI